MSENIYLKKCYNQSGNLDNINIQSVRYNDKVIHV